MILEIFSLIAILLCSLNSSSITSTNRAEGPARFDSVVLQVANEVANEQFKDFSYGDNEKLHQVNCVQFVAAVVERLINRPLRSRERDAIYIRYDFPNLDEAVASADPRTRGIQEALCSAMKIGTRTDVHDVETGDFIQYWIRKSNGSWFGHSAIISHVIEKAEGNVRVTLYGAHKTTDGIADTDFGGSGLQLVGEDRRVYLARFNACDIKCPWIAAPRENKGNR